MLKLHEVRSLYPELNVWTDHEITVAMHQDNPEMDLQDFATRFGGPLEETTPNIIKARDYNYAHPDAPIRHEDIGNGSVFADAGNALLAGVNDIGAGIFWLGEKGSEAIGADGVAEFMGSWKQEGERLAAKRRGDYSADLKIAMEKEFIEEDESGYSVGDAWSDPRAYLGKLGESAAGTIGGVGIAKSIAGGLMKLGASQSLSWAVGSFVGEGSIAGTLGGKSVYDIVMSMPDDKLAESPEFQTLLDSGLSPEQARRELANDLALKAGVTIGGVTGPLAVPSGIVFGKMLGGEIGKNFTRSVMKTSVMEAFEEMPQNMAEHYIAQSQLKRIDPTIDPTVGLANAAVEGGILGGVMGAGLGGFGHIKGAKARKKTAELDFTDAAAVAMDIDKGSSVDLLSISSNERLALPPGDGAMPMGTTDTGHGPIAPPTTHDIGPIATPYTQKLALPQETGVSAGSGLWPGGNSQLAYPWGGNAGNGMMRGIGLPAAAPVPQMPTATQVTSTQVAPRADTMDAAKALGMPAPNPMPVAATSPQNLPVVQQATDQQPTMAQGMNVAPQAMTPHYNAVGYVPEQRDAARTTPMTKEETLARLASMTRNELLDLFDEDELPKVKRLTKPKLVDALIKKNQGSSLPRTTVYDKPEGGRGVQPVAVFDGVPGNVSDPANEKLLGKNHKGQSVYQDTNGVRSVEEYPGVRATQDVSVSPHGIDFESPQALLESGKRRFITTDEIKNLSKQGNVSDPSGNTEEQSLPDTNTGVKSEQKQATDKKQEEVGRGETIKTKARMDDSGGDEGTSSNDVQGAARERRSGKSGADTSGNGNGSIQLRGRSENRGADSAGTQGVSSRPDRKNAAGDNDTQSGLGRSLESGVGLRDRSRGDTGRDITREGHGRTQGLNYIAPAGTLVRTGSWKDTASRNLDIVELVKRLEQENRQATHEEQALLAQYVGWGPSEIRNKLFPTTGYAATSRTINPHQVPSDWKNIAERAKALLTRGETETAFQSTQYAHYTSEAIIRSIWNGIQRLGFTGGKIFEPGMGTGLFAVAGPADIMQASTYTGIEMDKATAMIARHLLPESNIINGDFVKQKFPDNFFDLAIGNPPFAQTKILDDPAYKKHRFMLHDYFFAKSIDKVRPGGLLVFVTSKGTMDKQNDAARNYLAERADLLGAIRLPQTAFMKNAGTEVVTDVLFLRKRVPGEEIAGEKWLGLSEAKTPEGATLVNEYFTNHPEMVLGSHSLQGSMYRADSYTVIPKSGENIETLFNEATKRLPENIYEKGAETSREAQQAQVLERDFNPRHTKDGAIYLDEKGNLRLLEDGSGVDIDSKTKLSPADKAWLKAYVELRDALKQAQYDQLHDGPWEKSLKDLNAKYDAFVKQYGNIKEYKDTERTSKNKDGEDQISVSRRFKNKRLYGLDIESPLVEQIEDIQEDGQIVKAPFMLGRTIRKPTTPEIKTISDAYMVSLDQRGVLDIGHIAKLAGKSKTDVITELGDGIYNVPGHGWQTADEYLSGDVVLKLEEAEAAAKSDKEYERNVSALIKVQPKPLEAKNITVDLGSVWIPDKYYTAFVKDVLGESHTSVSYNKDAGTFNVPGSEKRSHRSSSSEWGTPYRSPLEILSAILNNQSIKVTEKDVNGKVFTNSEATAAANEKMQKMREAFSAWIWQDADRVKDLTSLYNRKFNNIAPRRFDGSHLTLPGLSLRYKLYGHQKRAIWRIIQTGNTYLAHAVGAGKTLEMIVSGMEQRRLGLINRPMYVVPNHMLNQFSSEFQDAYPLARVMVADEENFTGDTRRRFVAQAALNDPDAIIITHSAFGRISPKPETLESTTREFMAQLEAALEDAQDRISRSKLEQRIEQMQRKMDAKLGKTKDQAVYFEDMGVDFLYVDEAHLFRKLDFVTNRANVKGIDPVGSERALDLYSKLEWLRGQNPQRSHVLASGTPVTNTMAELYTILRYMDPDGLERDGIVTFDAWASMYGRINSDLEQNAAGKYEFVDRFSKFVNVPELMSRVRNFMDVVTMSQLGELVQRPNLETGLPINVVAEASDGVKDYLENVLGPRIETSKKWKPSPDQKGNPDPIVSIITDGRLAALDLRFVSSLAKMIRIAS